MMQIPDEFYAFCLYLHQDSFAMYGTEPQDLINGALGFIRDEQQRAILRHYIDGLLTGDYSDEQLQAIYRSTDAEIGIDRGLRHFLGMVRDTIDRNVSP